jgi:NADH:ubiquinone oxidoreductase subunit K
MINLQHYLALSAALFTIGIIGVLSRKNILGVLMSIELLFNAASLNLVAFNRYLHPDQSWGQAISLFVITLAAAEAIVGLSLVLVMSRNFKTIMTDQINIMKG